MNQVHVGEVDLNLLVALDALLGERHVTRAARRIGITQSAMSHALGRLRALFGDPLFVRTPRAMIPTPRAQELVEPLRRALGELGQLLSNTPTFDPATAQRVFRVAAADYGELTVLPNLTAELERSAPGVTLVVESLARDWAAALESGAVDLVVAPGAEGWPSIYRQQLFTDRFVCLVRAGHPRVKRTLPLSLYVSLPHGLVSPAGRPGGRVDEVLAARGLSRRVVCNVPHFTVAPLVAASTDTVWTLPGRVAGALSAGWPLRTLPCPIDLGEVRMHQSWHERVHRDPAHVWFRALVARAAATSGASRGAKRRRARPADLAPVDAGRRRGLDAKASTSL